MASFLDEGFWRETKIRSSKGRWSPASPAGSALPLPWKKSPWGFACLSPETIKFLPPTATPPQPQAARVHNQLLQATPSVGIKRIFCFYICTPSPFYNDGLKPRCLQERGWNEYIHWGIQKMQFGGKCNNFLMKWVKDKNRVLSIIVDKIFWLSLRGKAACSFCFYYVNSEVAKVI